MAVPTAVLACAAIPAPLFQQALAATAGTLFEAAPFVLAVSLARGPFVRWTAALLGCGCGPGAGYAALSLPATALCWTVFGPAPALARFVSAVLLQTFARARGTRSSCEHATFAASDPLEQLRYVGIAAWLVALATIELPRMGASAAASLARAGALVPLEIIAGAVFGAIAPCATAAVATAAMVRVQAPLAAAAILATAGLVPRLRTASTTPRASRDARAGIALLGIACALLALRGGAGFVHPRLVPFEWFAAIAAVCATFARPRTSVPFSALAPLATIVALILGSPVPAVPLGSGALDDLYPGKPVVFTGTVQPAIGAVRLVRFAITCCRADATAITLPTDLHSRLPGGTWLEASGTIARDDVELYLHVARWRRVVAPADPYVYR